MIRLSGVAVRHEGGAAVGAVAALDPRDARHAPPLDAARRARLGDGRRRRGSRRRGPRAGTPRPRPGPARAPPRRRPAPRRPPPPWTARRRRADGRSAATAVERLAGLGEVASTACVGPLGGGVDPGPVGRSLGEEHVHRDRRRGRRAARPRWWRVSRRRSASLRRSSSPPATKVSTASSWIARSTVSEPCGEPGDRAPATTRGSASSSRVRATRSEAGAVERRRASPARRRAGRRRRGTRRRRRSKSALPTGTCASSMEVPGRPGRSGDGGAIGAAGAAGAALGQRRRGSRPRAVRLDREGARLRARARRAHAGRGRDEVGGGGELASAGRGGGRRRGARSRSLPRSVAPWEVARRASGMLSPCPTGSPSPWTTASPTSD